MTTDELIAKTVNDLERDLAIRAAATLADIRRAVASLALGGVGQINSVLETIQKMHPVPTPTTDELIADYAERFGLSDEATDALNELVLAATANEQHDIGILTDNLTTVYSHFSDTISKPTADPREVIEQAEARWQREREEAVAEEREACAAIAQKKATDAYNRHQVVMSPGDENKAEWLACQGVADAIRARGDA